MSAAIVRYPLRAGWYQLEYNSFEYNPHLIDESRAFHPQNAVRNELIKVFRSNGSWVAYYSTIAGAEGNKVYSSDNFEQVLSFAEDFVNFEALERLYLLNAHRDLEVLKGGAL